MTNKNNIINKFKYFIGLDDLEEEYDEELDEEINKENEFAHPIIKRNLKSNKIVNIHTNSNMRLVIHEPRRYDEAPNIVEDLKKRKPTVVNLQNLDSETKRKVFDFINGAIFALEGNIQKVATDIFILAPNNVEIDSNLRDELKNKGLFPWSK